MDTAELIIDLKPISFFIRFIKTSLLGMVMVVAILFFAEAYTKEITAPTNIALFMLVFTFPLLLGTLRAKNYILQIGLTENEIRIKRMELNAIKEYTLPLKKIYVVYGLASRASYSLIMRPNVGEEIEQNEMCDWTREQLKAVSEIIKDRAEEVKD